MNRRRLFLAFGALVLILILGVGGGFKVVKRMATAHSEDYGEWTLAKTDYTDRIDYIWNGDALVGMWYADGSVKGISLYNRPYGEAQMTLESLHLTDVPEGKGGIKIEYFTRSVYARHPLGYSWKICDENKVKIYHESGSKHDVFAID